MTSYRRPLLAILAGVAVLTLASPAGAIVVCDDPNAAWHLAPPPSDYQRVGMLTSGGTTSAVLINPWFIITADHALANYQTHSFKLDLEGGRQSFNMVQKIKNPDLDLSIARLARSTGMDGYELYRGSGELNQVIYLAGYGLSGTSGVPTQPKGTLRIGQNRVDTVYSQKLAYDFDPPTDTTSTGADKEVCIASGDSGGASFLRIGGQMVLAGIHSGGSDPDGYPEYGDWGYDIKISADYMENGKALHLPDWIDLHSQPATVTGDFNLDLLTDELDINALVAKFGGTDLWYDLTGDSVISRLDLTDLIHVKVGTEFGDADLDFEVGLSDYGILAANFGRTSGVYWQDGDFNSDGKVNFADYQILEAAFGFGGAQGSLPGVPLPEPVSLLLLGLGGLTLLRRRR